MQSHIKSGNARIAASLVLLAMLVGVAFYAIPLTAADTSLAVSSTEVPTTTVTTYSTTTSYSTIPTTTVTTSPTITSSTTIPTTTTICCPTSTTTASTTSSKTSVSTSSVSTTTVTVTSTTTVTVTSISTSVSTSSSGTTVTTTSTIFVLPTSTYVHCVPAKVHLGKSVDCTAIVKSSTLPSGTIQFGYAEGKIGVVNPSVTCTPIPSTTYCYASVVFHLPKIGSAIVWAAYSGDLTHQPSHGATMVRVYV